LSLSPGKLKGLRALANDRGVIAAIAIDQRSALRKLFAMASGRDANDIPSKWLVQFKEKVSQFLTPFASAILLDPEYGLPAADRRAKDTGLLLAYEQSGYDKSSRFGRRNAREAGDRSGQIAHDMPYRQRSVGE